MFTPPFIQLAVDSGVVGLLSLRQSIMDYHSISWGWQYFLYALYTPTVEGLALTVTQLLGKGRDMGPATCRGPRGEGES